MKKYFPLIALLIVGGFTTVLFQNCGQGYRPNELAGVEDSLIDPKADAGFGEPPDSFFEIEPEAGDEDQVQSSRQSSERSGGMSRATISGNTLSVLYNRGLRSSTLSSNVEIKKYYQKVIFFVNNEYFGYASNENASVSSSTTTSSWFLGQEQIAFLTNFNQTNLRVSVATIRHDGPTSKSNEVNLDVSSLMPSVPVVVAPESDKDDVTVVSGEDVCPTPGNCPIGKFAITGRILRTGSSIPLVVYILSNKGKFCAYNKVESASQSIAGDAWVAAVRSGQVVWDQKTFDGGFCGQ